MKNVPENELLSAYLDGELTADEQADVEQLLATSPAARQLVDELRALRSTLQALPAHQFGYDISAEVLRRAQQQKGTATEPPKPGKDELPLPESPMWRRVLRRARQPRALAWSGVAVSAALLLLVLGWISPGGSRPTPIAQKGPASGAELESAARPADTPEAAGEMLGREASLVDLADADDEGHRRDAAFSDIRAPHPSPETEAAFDAPAPEARRLKKLAEAVPVTEAPKTAPSLKRGPEGGLAGYGGMGARGGTGRDRLGQRVAPIANGAPPPEKSVALRAAGVAVTPPSEAAIAALTGGAAQPGEVLVTLRCSATAEAVPLFEDLLKRQQVTLVGTGEEWGMQAGPLNGHMPATTDGKLFSAVAKHASEIHYDFEATPDQLVTLVAFVNGRPEDFSPLTSLPAGGAVSEDRLNLTGTTRVLEQQATDASQNARAPFRGERIDPLGLKEGDWREQAGPERGRPFQADAEVDLEVKEKKLGEAAADQGQAFHFRKEPTAEPEGDAAVEASEMFGRQEGAPRLPQFRKAPGRSARGGVRVEPSPPSVAPGRDSLVLPPQSHDQIVAKYRVRFVLAIVRRPGGGMAASVAKESAESDAETKAASRPGEPAEGAPANRAKPAEVEP